MDIPGAIIICGMQVDCRGNEATGTMTLTEPEAGLVHVPCCEQCAEWVEARYDETEETIEE